MSLQNKRWLNPRFGKQPLVALLSAGVLAAVVATGGVAASGAFHDQAQANVEIQTATWPTSACVLGAVKTSNSQFTISSHTAGSAPFATSTWVSIVDKGTVTDVAGFAGCSLLLTPAEEGGVSAVSYALLLAWFNAGGRVLTTGDDSGSGVFLMPDMLESDGVLRKDRPSGGSVRLPAADTMVPVFPAWTPGAYGMTVTNATTVTPAPGATCVARVGTDATLCAAIAKTNAAGGKWIHVHGKIGRKAVVGDYPLVDAAVLWLVS